MESGKNQINKGVSFLTIRAIGESLGIKDLPIDITNTISNEVTFRIYQILQLSDKYRHHEKRKKFTSSDLSKGLSFYNMPFFMEIRGSNTPLRKIKSSNQTIFTNKKYIKLGRSVYYNYPSNNNEELKSEILAFDGIPKNEFIHSLNLETEYLKRTLNELKEKQQLRVMRNLMRRRPRMETIFKKELANHPLSSELQKYYRDITEACVGCSEARRQEALQVLMTPIAIPLMPYFSAFIVMGVKVNIINGDLALLIYLMRMLRALLDNTFLYIDKYLHELLPAAISCVVARHLCSRPILDNHWTLRDFAARMVAHIVINYNSSVNKIKQRVVAIYKSILDSLHSQSPPLDTLYGVIQGIITLGPKISKQVLKPKIKSIGYIIQSLPRDTQFGLENKQAAERIQKIIVHWLTEIINEEPEKGFDLLSECRSKYGFFGTSVYLAFNQNKMANNDECILKRK